MAIKKTSEQAPPTLSVVSLGSFEMSIGDLKVTDEINRSQKLWNLLSYLIFHRERNIPQSEFIELLWPDETDGNPLSALKTLFFRVRKMLLPIFGEEYQFITSRRSSYSFNSDIKCALDTEIFEEKCRMGDDTSLSENERIDYYIDALSLYRGYFLPKLTSKLWTVPLREHYHSLYINSIKELSSLLLLQHRPQEAAAICNKAISIDPYVEDFYCFLIKSLLAGNKHAAALKQYESATDFLYKNLGVHPSLELRSLYSQIMDTQKSIETDLETIQNTLSENDFYNGAYYCEFGFFQEAYRVAARMANRTGSSIQIILFTLSSKEGKLPDLELLSSAMKSLMNDIRSSLRRGDIFTRYSGAQYLLMCPRANYEDSVRISDRICVVFSRHAKFRKLHLDYKIQQLKLQEALPEPLE